MTKYQENEEQPRPSGDSRVIGLLVIIILGIVISVGIGGAAILGLIVGTSTATPRSLGPTPPHDTFYLQLPADSEWVDSGVYLREGERVIINADGRISLSDAPDFDGWVGPEGFTTPCAPIEDSLCVMEGAPYGILIGQIGDGDPFRIGPRTELIATQTGSLYLAVNDNYGLFGDNSGEFEITIATGFRGIWIEST